MPDSNAKLILADPDLSNRDALEQMLVGTGVSCLYAGSADAVLDLLREHEPLAVFVDVAGMDGYRLLNAMRSEDALAEVPVVFLLSSLSNLRTDLHGGDLTADEVLLKPVDAGKLRAVVNACREMARQRALFDQLELQQDRILEAPQGILGVDIEGIVRYANPTALNLLAGSLSRLQGLPLLGLLERPHQSLVSTWKQSRIYRTCVQQSQVMHVKSARFCSLSGASLVTTYVAKPAPEGSGLALVLAFESGGYVQGTDDQGAELSRPDALTGLPTRRRFELALANAISHAEASARNLSVLSINLDHFRYVNDTLGHDFGDQLLRQAAKRMREVLRADELLARMSGDEFVVLLPDQTDAAYAAIAASRLIHVLETPFLIDGHEVFTGASVGIATYPHCGDQHRVLMRNADTALHRAKAAGGHQFEFYTAEMNRQNLERMQLAQGLHHALERDELRLVYLPLVELRSGRIVGLEALLRWEHPERGLLLPADFMGVAEEASLHNEFTRWVLQHACADMVAWRDRYPDAEQLVLAVNVPTAQLAAGELLHDVRRQLHTAGLPATALQLDLGERGLASSLPEGAATVAALSEMGVRLALDDLGAGYSSLRHLQMVDFDAIKIDRSLIAGLCEGGRDAVIVRSVITMARSLGLRVIAEGVERAEQMEFLRRKRCDWVQGFHFSAPVNAGKVDELLSGGLAMDTSRTAEQEEGA